MKLPSEGGYNVGWIQPGEWLEYSVNTTGEGDYTLDARVASIEDQGSFYIEVNGQNLSGSTAVPNTGGWQTWQSVNTEVRLAAGEQIIRIVMDGGNFNLDKISFSSKNTTITNQSPTITLTTPTANTTIEEGSSMTLMATASDSDDGIADVTFYANNAVAFKDTQAPYEYEWSPSSGDYTIQAIVTDNTGATTTSLERMVTVNSVTTTNPPITTACGADQYVENNGYVSRKSSSE